MVRLLYGRQFFLFHPRLFSQTGMGGPADSYGWHWDAHAGVGLTNTKQRLEQLYPAAHQLTVSNAVGGVTVEITLPFRTNGAKPEEDAHG